MTSDYTKLLAQADEHIKNKEYAQAEEIYLQICGVDASNIDALNGCAITAFYRQDYKNAILLLEKAININPSYAHLHYNLSIYYHAQSNIDQALVACKVAVDLLPTYADAQQFLVTLYSEKSAQQAGAELWEEALATLTNVLAFDESILSADIYYQLGFYSEKSGQSSRARHYWEKVKLIDPHHPHAQVALYNLYKANVPNWHLPMMNDEVRNKAFQTVIERNSHARQTVLDIGAGSGLMSMIAARAGNKVVYACEEVELISEKAAELITASGFSNEQIKLIKKRSTHINIPGDMPDKVDMIVTETFGTGLIEENCLETINHAIKNLLKPNGTIIPKGAALYVSLVESSDLHKLFHAQNVCGFDLSGFDEFSELRVSMWPDHLNHYAYKILTNTHLIKKFDFYSESTIFEKEQIQLVAATNGVGHALCIWFDLYVDDTTTITTNPAADAAIQAKSWGQRIRTLSEPLIVRQGDVINIELTNENNYISAALI
jgi:type II protein arginine methyltransferase